MILGLTGMMLLGAQSIYAAEAADGTAETTEMCIRDSSDRVKMANLAQIVNVLQSVILTDYQVNEVKGEIVHGEMHEMNTFETPDQVLSLIHISV